MIRINIRMMLFAAAFSLAGLAVGISYVAINYSTPGESRSAARKTNANPQDAGSPSQADPTETAAPQGPQMEIPAGL